MKYAFPCSSINDEADTFVKVASIAPGSGNDIVIGNDGNDIFYVEEGLNFEIENNSFDGGEGVSWVDQIDMSEVTGEYGTDWVVVLDGNVDPEPAPETQQLELGQDASGEIQFTQGGSITFENVEKIVW